MANPILLTTLALMTAFSGCIGGEAEITEPEPAPAAISDAPASTQTTLSPGCAANSDNYGLEVNIENHQIKLENGATWYEESNGIYGIQTETECPEKPDTKYVHQPVW